MTPKSPPGRKAAMVYCPSEKRTEPIIDFGLLIVWGWTRLLHDCR